MEHSGVIPDLMTMAKSLAGGFPLSAVTGRAEIMDAPAAGGLGGTYAGSPLALAAAGAVLEIIAEEGLCERAVQLGARLSARLESLAEQVAEIAEVRGLGAMVAAELMRDARGGERVGQAARARGLAAVGLAEEDLAAAAVQDGPGRDELDADPREPDEERRKPEPIREDRLVLDPVLEREDDGVGSEHAPERGGHRFRVVRLDAHEHQIGGRRLGRMLDGADGLHLERVGADQDPQTVGAEGRQVRAARDEGDVVAAGREPRPEVAADGAGTVHEDVHGSILPGRRAA